MEIDKRGCFLTIAKYQIYCKIILSCENGMGRLQVFDLTLQRMVTCTYHLNLPAAVSNYGRRYQGRHCTYADGLSCLFRLTTPPFFFTTKTTSPLCKFWGNKLQECIAATFVQS